MNKRLQVITVLLVSLIGAPVFAKDAKKAEKELAAAKISLIKAVEIAEKHLEGKALSADLDVHRAGAMFEVEVFANGRLYDVDVNAADGAVIRAREDLD